MKVWACLCLTLVLVLVEDAAADDDERKWKSRVFTQFTRSNYSSRTFGDSWLEDSVGSCITTCIYNYTPCYSVTYNTRSKTCTAGSQMFYEDSGRRESPDDELFYAADFCNETNGFKMFTFASVVQCLYISETKSSFDGARRSCRLKDSLLYTAETDDKLTLFSQLAQNVIRYRTWLGLSKRDKKNFEWENGHCLINSFKWAQGQSDNNNKEDCAEIRENGIFDADCRRENYFICEANL